MKLEEIKKRLSNVITSQVIDPTGRNATADVHWLIRRVEKLEEALKVYAREAPIISNPHTTYFVQWDDGSIAREALAEDE